jgi:hypothetical protein
MATVEYTINSGNSPFTVALTPSLIPVNTHENVGTYSFTEVPDGEYMLIITDSNSCEYQKELIINSANPVIDPTIMMGDSIVVGQSQDEELIFNEAGTNRNNGYTGYPDSDIVPLYLWFKTLDGKALTEERILDYEISGTTNGVTFTYNMLSDQINAEVTNASENGLNTISGNIRLKVGFIETFFKNTMSMISSNPTFVINLTNDNNGWFNTDIDTTVISGNQYGVTNVDVDCVELTFAGDNPNEVGGSLGG